ncbi:MAG: 30S ribosomal protein S3 [Candidatus Moranbacteria bacterium]|jgi:small subunit ribosomal protein S3|nr:30S ribosomal protein S3 [Candidatus Moranbacteria bacterium]MBP9801151.1 30S ribosomal protein S3 [Candidatus Moranbacteria bacterium]
MGHKTNPIGIRLGITADWQSRWFANAKLFKTQLRSDVEMHDFIMKKWKQAAIASVQVERSAATIRVIIETSRPGVLIGRGGTGIEDLARVVKNHFFRGKKTDLKVEVKEIKRFEESASLVGQQIAEQLEKRIPFRRALKGMIDQVTQNKDILGVKIEISGRLGGAEMRRREWLSKGKIPLHTLRADIDFARVEANTTYGVIGIKVWIYKGEKFEEQSTE